jgi:hypothetical protein
MEPQTEPQLILPPIRAMASLVTVLTVAWVGAILFTHLAHSEPRPVSPPGHVNVPGAFYSNARPGGRSASYPYTDPDTIGMY